MSKSTGSLWRAIARSSLDPKRYRSVSEASPSSARHASSSRVTLGIGESSPRERPSPSARTNSRMSNVKDANSDTSQRQRRLVPPNPGRGVTNVFIDEAKRDMQLRRMPYNEADLQWLRDARQSVFTLNSKQTALQAEQKELSAELNKHFQGEARSAKKSRCGSRGANAEAEAKESTKKPAEIGESEAADAQDAATKAKAEHVQVLRQRAKKIKEELDEVQKEQNEILERSQKLRLSWPNHCHPDVPVGSEENAVLVSVKDPLNILPREFDVMKESWNQSLIQAKHFPEGPKADPTRDHLSQADGSSNGEVDIISGTLATGSSWPYLLGSVSLLEHALSQYAMSIVVRKGFLAVSPPDVVRADLADRCGFRPRDEKAKQTYFLEGIKTKGKQEEVEVGSNDLCLAATAEIPLAGLLASRMFDASKTTGKGRGASLIQSSEFPIKLAALGHAFRAEAGARGADTRGLYRVHQFSKIEMFVATLGDVMHSDAMLEELRGIQEEVIGGLGLPYRVLDMPTEELGASAYRKYDIEVWMPGRGSWGEVSSASNCTDYQALRLGIKMKRGTSSNDRRYPTVHTLNATAAAIPRLIVAILENHGTEKGKLVLPDTLKPFWLAGENDPNVTWLYTGKLDAASQSRFKRALTQVRSIAKKNGTNAPTMIASFLILHELTAILPLAVLFFAFGAFGVGTAISQWLLGNTMDKAEQRGAESPRLRARFRAWAQRKEERFERYCRKRGYLGFDKQTAEEIEAADDLGKSSHLAGSFANMVAAYIIVKALLPVRIGASVALAGPFSRTVLEPLKRMGRRVAFVKRAPST